VQRGDPSIVVVAGVSLPVLLAWVTGTSRGEVAADAEVAAEKGRRALLVTGAVAPGAAGGR
jgi:hypothetical protein